MLPSWTLRRRSFDTVWHAGLMIKYISGHLWRVTYNWYASSTSCVLWSVQHSPSFLIEQGVWLGGILSPFLYCIFLDELLDQFSSSGVGASVAGIYFGSPTYVDDISLIADSPTALQIFLTWSISTLRSGDTSLMA